MVQVDVLWGYGWGASLAAAAGPRLAREKKPLESGYFTSAVLFLALCWAPTGLLLLLRHPSWETMQVADSFSSLSEWLVLAFGITNVTQGLLGFWVGLKLLERKKSYLAQLNWILGYYGMFLILLHGWDGLGYDRFLYDRDLLAGAPAWQPGAGTAIGVLPALIRFLKSGVAKTLYLDGVYLLPPFFWLATRWHRLPALKVVATYLGGVFLVGLGSAAVTALAVGELAHALGSHALAYLIGVPASAAMLWLVALRPKGVAWRLLSSLRHEAG